MKHILLAHSKSSLYSEKIDMPENCFYNSLKGFWEKNDEVLISHNSEFGTRLTKKNDIETGEDQKGE